MITLPTQLQNKNFRFIKIKPGEKIPSEEDWPMSANYKYNEKEFQEYLKTNKAYGVTGGFGKLVIIDTDTEKCAKELTKQFADTFIVRSAKRKLPHIYLIVKDMANTIKLDKGEHHGEIQWHGAQVIGPGSSNEHGEYEVVADNEIKTVTKKELLVAIKPFVKEIETHYNTKGCKYDITTVIDLTDFKPSRSKEGEYQGVNPFVASETGRNFNVDTENNWFKDWHNGIGGNTIDWIAIKEGVVSYDNFVELKRQGRRLNGTQYTKACEIGRTKYKLPIPERKLSLMVKNAVTGKQELNIEGIVDRLEEDYHFITVEDNTGMQPHLYVYKDGYYVIKGLQGLEKIVKKMFRKSPHQWKTWYRNEIKEYIKTENIVSRDDIEPPSNFINLNNGVYDINSKKLLPHDPKYYFLYKIPINYNPERQFKGSGIEKYFIGTLEPVFVKMSQELFGYCMYSRYNLHGIFYLFGPGGNGKGVWEYLLINMLGGANNVSSKELHRIANDRFTSGLLYGKLANISGEMSQGILNHTNIIKSLSAGDSIAGELKGMNGFDFNNKAKIIVAANEISYSTDKTPGWYQRQYVIPFCVHFRGVKGVEKPDLRYKLATDKKEMETLLLWAIEGLHRLLENKQFTYPGDHEKTYRLCIRPEYKFVDMCCVINKKWNEDNKPAFVTCKEIYKTFTEWCEKYHIPRPSNDALDRAITRRGWEAGKRRTINRKQVAVRDSMNLIHGHELNLLELEMADEKE